MKNYDLTIIGGGPAGMAAALAAYRNNIKKILIIERDVGLGGILNQCMHSGFGLHRFKKELTGPEYSNLMIQEILNTNIEYMTNTMVLKIDPDRVVHAISQDHGYLKINSKAIALAMGCRERTRSAIRIHGSRPAGIYTAGIIQRLVNIDGFLPGKKIVIIGSGDIGLIMAREMTLAGVKIEAVLEILPYSNALPKNLNQCLYKFNIPLLLKTTITKIHGKERVEGVTFAEVDDSLTPISSTERFIPCDTVLLSVGLIPENELSRRTHIDIDPKTNGPVVGELRQTSKDGIFACGNVLQVHDLVDFVSEEGELAGFGASQYIKNQLIPEFTHYLVADRDISYVVPQKINVKNISDKVKLFMRVKNIFANCTINAYLGNKIIASKKEDKFSPAEMVNLELTKRDLSACNEKEIQVKIEPLN